MECWTILRGVKNSTEPRSLWRRAKGFTPPLTPPKPLLNPPLKGRTSCGKCNASNTVPTPNPSPSRGGEPRPSFLPPPLEGEGLGVGARSEKPMEKASVRGRSSGFGIRSHRIEGFAIPQGVHRIYCSSEVKHRRCERLQTGVSTPGTGTSTKQNPERVTEKAYDSVVPSWLLSLSHHNRRLVPPSVLCRLFET